LPAATATLMATKTRVKVVMMSFAENMAEGFRLKIIGDGEPVCRYEWVSEFKQPRLPFPFIISWRARDSAPNRSCRTLWSTIGGKLSGLSAAAAAGDLRRLL
jgi:hypothetical protein